MNTTPKNGSEQPTRSARGNIAHFLRDLASLIELQGLLFLVDAGDEFRKSRRGLLLLVVFAALAASCLPVGLAGLSLVLAETTGLTIGQALLSVSLACGLLSGWGCYAAAQSVKPDVTWMQRSRTEWKCNSLWMKDTLMQLGDGACVGGPARSRQAPEQRFND
jgi:hypothetical protein